MGLLTYVLVFLVFHIGESDSTRKQAMKESILSKVNKYRVNCKQQYFWKEKSWRG
jgi:type IV secretory pathway VirB3-like protein